MISIISAFGGQRVQDELYKDMQSQDMFFSSEDCNNGIMLLMAVEQNPDVDVIIIGQIAVKDIEIYLAQIREITNTARIVLLLNGLRKQYVQTQYEGYCKRYNVEDIIFEGNGIDKLEILSAISKGRLPVEQKIKEDSAVNKPKSAEKPQRYKLPVIDIKPKKKKLLPNRSLDEGIIISLFGTTHGAGVTNMTASLAEYLAMNNKRVIAFNLSGGDEFKYINGQAQYRDVKSLNVSEVKKNYDFILLDLGVPYKINSGGHYSGFSDGYNYRNIEFLKKSSLNIVMSLSDAWHIKKCEYLLTDEQWVGQISNSYIFLFDTAPPKLLKKYAINQFERNSQSFADEIARLFLIGEER